MASSIQDVLARQEPTGPASPWPGKGKPLELLRKYGGSIEEMRKLTSQLPSAMAKWRTQHNPPVEPRLPVTLSANEARQYGMDVEPGWQVKVMPVTNPETGQPHYHLVSPEGWEVTDYGTYISPGGERYSQDEFAKLSPEQQLSQAMAGRQPSGPATPWQGPIPQGGLPSTEMLPQAQLREAMEGRMPTGPATPYVPQEELQPLYDWAEQNPNDFASALAQEGRTPQTEAMVRAMFPDITPQEMDDLLGEQPSITGEGEIAWATPETLGLPEVESKFEWSLRSIWGRIKDIGTGAQRSLVNDIKEGLATSAVIPEHQREWIRETGVLPKVYMQLTPEELEQLGVQLSDTSREVLRRIQTTGLQYEYWESSLARDEYQPSLQDQFEAGWGDVLATAGATANWLGQDGVGQWLAERGSQYQAVVPPAEWKGVFHPNFWTKQVPRALPFTLSLIPAAIAGGYAGAGVAGAVGLGAFGKLVLGSVGAAALSRPLESALEAGSAYDQAMAKGFGADEAEEAADQAFKGNLALAGMDAAQFAMAFAPRPFRTGSRLLRYASIGGKLTVVGLSEAGEEAVQDVLIRRALDERVTWDAEMQQAVSLGMVMGVGLGGVGEVYSTLQQNVKDNLTSGLNDVFNKARLDGLEQGLTEEQAELKALDAVAQTPDGKRLVQQVVDRTKQAEQAKQDSAFDIGNISDTKITVDELGLRYNKLPHQIRTRLESFEGGKENFPNYTVYNFARFIHEQFTEMGKKSALLQFARNPEVQKIFAYWASNKGIFTANEADAITAEMLSQERHAQTTNLSIDKIQEDLKAELQRRAEVGEKLPVGVQGTEKSITDYVDGMAERTARDWHSTIWGEPTPRGTTQHPQNVKAEEAGNTEISKEVYDAVPTNELDVVATRYLREGNVDQYIADMPEYSELKLQALSDEVRGNITELVQLRDMGRQEIRSLTVEKDTLQPGNVDRRTAIDAQIAKLQGDIEYFDTLMRKVKGGDQLTITDAMHLGMALRTTREGNLGPAVRRSGFYVSDEFAQYPYFQDVSLPSGNFMDPIRLCQAIDGGYFGGALQKHLLWPTQRTYLAYLQFVDNTKARVHELAERYGLTGFGSKQARQAAGDVVEYIGQAESMQTAQELMNDIPEVAQFVRAFDPGTQRNIIDFAKEVRHFFDDMLDVQNAARTKRQQEAIPYRRNYRQWVLETNLWARLLGRIKKPAAMMQSTPRPDYIKPDAPFNARAQARQEGLANYLKERDLVTLMYDYATTAGKDLFMTNIVQNGKVHASTLRSMGHENSAILVEDWISEAYAGVTPSLSRAIRKVVPMRALRFGFWLRRQLTRAVFPLNWTWNLFVQTSSISLATTRYGIANTIKGLDYLLMPSIHQQTRQNAYSAIIKGRRGGRVAYQDIGAQVEKSLKLEGSILDKVEHMANFLTNTIEMMLTGVSIRAAYHHGQKLGYEGRALWEYASEGGAKTQSMYNFENLPGILRNKEVGTLLPFQTFCLEVFNTVREIVGVRAFRAGTYQTVSADSAAGQATIHNRVKMVLTWIGAMVVINAVADKYINRKPWRLSSFIPFFSIMGAGMDSQNPWYLPMPLKYVNDFKRGIEDVVQYDDWRDLRQWFTRYHILGGTQISRMLDALDALTHGEWTDVRGKQIFEVDPDEWLTALTRGIYNTKGGQEYIDKLNEKRGKWYEILGFALPERVNISTELEREFDKLGATDEDGATYNFGDFVSALRDVRRSVGERRFNKADSPFTQGFLEAEKTREKYEQLPYQAIYLMDQTDWEAWLHYQTLEGKEKENFAKENPEVLQEWRGKYYDLWREYNNLGSKEERDAFLESHPDLMKDWRTEWRIDNPDKDAMLAFWGFPGRLQTREAYNQVTKMAGQYNVPLEHLKTWLPPEHIADDYFDYLHISDEFGASSAEAYLFRLEHGEFNEWGLDAYGWRESTLRDKNVDVLRIQVKHRDLFEQYEAFGNEESPQYVADDEARDQARLRLLRQNPEFRDDRNRLEVFRSGGSDEMAEYNVAYGRIVEESGANSAEARLYRLENPEFGSWGQENWGWKEVDDNPDALRISVEWRDKDNEYDALEDREARQNFLEKNPDYHKARRRREAYTMDFPEKLIDEYVHWYTTDELTKPEDYEYDQWYEDDWWLMEHQDFYREMVDMGVWQERDFSTVPTRKVFSLYKSYKGLPLGTPRLQFRLKNPELDKWLVEKFGYKPAEEHGQEPAEEKGPWEEAEEAEAIKDWIRNQ